MQKNPSQNPAPPSPSPQPPLTSMADSTSPTSPKPFTLCRALGLLLLVAGPVLVSLILQYQPPGFDPSLLPGDHSFGPSITVPEHYGSLLGDTERVGDGLLPGPEDIAYDSETGFIYTGCHDGWIRRVRVPTAVAVEDWAHVGGRPLGVALAPDGSIVVAEANKGLMMVKSDKSVHLLIDEAEGVKFRLTDGVDVASDSIIYFTDASDKYNLDMHMLDVLEGRPHGRLISFDPSTNKTVVLLRDLYFANGLSLSPDQQSLIFCETPLRRCKRYYIQGEKIGTVEKFIENLPGFPDNIRYDRDGSYWIGIAAGRTLFWDMIFKYPFLRKFVVFVSRFVELSHMRTDAGVMSVNLEGKPVSLYSDPRLYAVTTGLKIGEHLYYGSLDKTYIGRVDIKEDAMH